MRLVFGGSRARGARPAWFVLRSNDLRRHGELARRLCYDLSPMSDISVLCVSCALLSLGLVEPGTKNLIRKEI